MKRDGRTLDHATLEEFRLLALRRVREGEKPSAVVKSLGMNRTSIYRWLKAASGRGKGERALAARACHGASDQAHAHAARAGVSLDQRQGPAAVRLGLRAVDATDCGHAHRAEVRRQPGRHRRGQIAGPTGPDAAKAPAARLPARPAGHRALAARDLPGIAAAARQSGADIYFWDESGFRADTVHGKTWAPKGKTPVIQRPGQRQSISAASAVNAKGGFWFATYQGALNAELFIELLKKLMKGRSKPVHLVVDGLPAHKKANVREYIASTQGKLSMHVLPGYAPDLNPDELVWSHVKRTGVARNPLRAGEKLEIRIEKQLHDVQKNRRLVRSFFGTPSVAYISDC